MQKKAKKVALVGRNGSGKSQVAEYLVQKGFQWVSLSTILRSYAKQEGIETNREKLIAFGSKIKDQQGPAVLAEQALLQLQQYPERTQWVFDSVRLPQELQCLKKNGFYVLGIEAKLEIRYQRITTRGNDTDFIDFETFKAQDDKEFYGLGSGQHIEACFRLCDMMIKNEGDLLSLQKEVDLLC